jgi:eukaryotic-like serine/threonine-protein kinase
LSKRPGPLLAYIVEAGSCEKGTAVLTPGQEYELSSGRRLGVERFIGEGGQGTVYEVTVDDAPIPAALKWYFPATGTEQQRTAIEALARRGAPNSRFLWPSEVVVLPDQRAFGYLMPLRPAGYATLAALLKGRVDAPAASRATLCRELARSFLDLHSQGLCYRDISFANIFLDPHNGRPLICDNDNVAIDDGSPSPVLGTRKFMAPEIVRGDAQPSTSTDLWSLAVLLFYILVVGHPLMGRRERDFVCWDEDAELELFGRHPLFVFDPDDATNRPDRDHDAGMYTNWNRLPTRVRALFTQAFTRGTADADHGRVAESVWQRAMSRLQDSVVVCSGCGAELFFDPEQSDQDCWACGRAFGRPMLLDFGEGRWIALSDRTRIWNHHVARLPSYDFETPVAEVARHPTQPGVWGLTNIGDANWVVRPPNGDDRTIEPGRSFALVPGTVFRFGETEATLTV